MFITAIIFGLLALAAFIVSLKLRYTKEVRADRDDPDARGTVYSGFTKDVPDPGLNKVARCIAAGLAAVMLIFGFFSVTYTQGPGEAKVLKTMTGAVVGEDTTAGLSFKAPWVSTVSFDVTNNLVAFVGDGSTSYNGQKANGPQITFTDKDGATADFDVAVTYSLKPDAVAEIYTKYRNQDNFASKLVEQDVRSVAREVPAKFGTLELLTNRDKLATQLRESLLEKWEGKGIIVDQVSPQEIRYSPEVKARFDGAQGARVDNEKAKAELETATINAKQKVVQAEAEAEANRKLAESLTEPILRQRYIDALSKSKFIVVPEGGNNIINLPAGDK